MDVIDVGKEQFREVEIKGHMGLFTDLRVDKSTMPEGMNCYELRHGDDRDYPVALEQNVCVNYFGAVLMADKLDLGENGRIALSYDDFVFYGEELSIPEYRANYLEEPDWFPSGAEFARFMNEDDRSFPLTEKEAEILLGYLGGSDFILGQKEGKLFRGDTDYAPGVIRWVEDTIDDVVHAAYEWNDEIIKMTEAQIIIAETPSDCVREKERLASLREDEKILDTLFDRTRYGKELDELARKLAEELIQDLQSPEGIDGAIQRMTEEIAAGKDLLPDASPILKQNTERAR